MYPILRQAGIKTAVSVSEMVAFATKCDSFDCYVISLFNWHKKEQRMEDQL